jgi:outer membrane protein assembly factor BamD (BamD/ComL family)
MKNLLIIATLAILAMASCTDKTDTRETNAAKKDSLFTIIDELEARAFAEQVRMDKTVGNLLMKEYINYANNFHEDSLAAGYLFKAGSIARNLTKYRKAIEIFQNVHDGFPNYQLRTEAMFLIAFIYDNDLNDRIRARDTYELVVKTYPDHKFAEDAASRIETLHMTDEQLIEFFMEKNAESADSGE